MSANTKIEWADHTFNPWMGCQKVSPACDHCYAEVNTAVRSLGVKWGPGAERRRTSAGNWQQPVRWNAEAARLSIRYRVFCASLADWADNSVPREWRADLGAMVINTPHLDWLLLTKRIGNASAMLDEMFPDGIPPNVWIGATICNQEEADRDIPKLLAIPAHKRFLSMEPLLGMVDLRFPTKLWGGDRCNHCCNGDRCDDRSHFDRRHCPYCRGTGKQKFLDWVIVGGESGHHARPMHPDWARSLRDQCEAAGVPFLFKQWGEWREPLEHEDFDTSMGRAAKTPAFILSEDGTVHCFEGGHIIKGRAVIKVGKKAAGRLLDGHTWDGVPT